MVVLLLEVCRLKILGRRDEDVWCLRPATGSGDMLPVVGAEVLEETGMSSV